MNRRLRKFAVSTLERGRFERYAQVMGWETIRLGDGYYTSSQMNDFWALWMGCVEFEAADAENHPKGFA